jgi:conjugative relaxase-like TrwC/TraI family protein
MIVLRIIAVGTGAVNYLLEGSGCCPEHERAQDLDAPGHGLEHGRGTAQERAAVAGSAAGSAGGAARYFGAAVEHGEPAGVWGGRGLGLLGIEEGARASESFVRAVFGRLEDPRSGESLGRAPRTYKGTEERVAAAVAAAGPDITPERRRQLEVAAAADGRRAVAYYDFTFSPAKSVSVYYAALLAAGQHGAAGEVAAAHERAVTRAMAYAEEHLVYTRAGYHGRTAEGRSVGRYEAGEGLIWTAWRHSTNREREPQLHTHVAVLNRVRTLSDGVVRALDGRGFRPVKEALATAYERALEEELVAARAVVFADRPDGKVREIVGIDPELCGEASTRRAQTLAKAEELTALYVARNGREPDAAARKAILHDAAMGTRNPKTGAQGPAAVADWARTGSRAERLMAALEAVADAAEAAAAGQHPDVAAGVRLDPMVPEQRRALLAAAVAEVQAAYPSWTVGNLVAAIDRRVGALPVEVAGAGRPAFLERLAGEVLAAGNEHGVLLLTAADPVAVPEQLRRVQDGRSVFRPHIDERYATAAQLRIEEQLVVGARQPGAPAVGGPELELLRVELAAHGLSPDQVAAVAGVVSSGRRADVLIGPAGAGKSRTVATLARVWGEQFGGRVLGLATSQNAAQVLAADGVPALNTARFLLAFAPGPNGEPPREQVRTGDLFVVDEAGMSATAELARIAQIVADGGGKIVYTGDSEQLVSVGAGGMLGLLAADNGAFELTEVHRFAQAWEREASLRLRAGDPTVIPEYEDRGRLQAGTAEEMTAAAVRGYLADVVEGKDSLLVAASNQQAAALAKEVRRGLVEYGRVDPEPLTWLGSRAEKVPVSVGDRIEARHNDWSIPVDAGPGGVRTPVFNRGLYTVVGRNPNGALRVQGAAGEIAHLPPDYVQQHVTLAYACTVNGAQGRTVDTSHAVLDESATRNAAYVALSRGREANIVYLVARRDPDAHDQQRLEQAAAGRLATILGTEEARPAAEEVRRAGAAEQVSLAWVGGQWDAVAGQVAHDRYRGLLAGLLEPERHQRLVAEPGWARLVRAVRQVELAGHHGDALLRSAVAGRPLTDAQQLSDVIRWRVRRLAADRTPEVAVAVGDWTALAPPTDGPVGQFAHELAVLAADRQHALGHAAAADPPGWALTQLGPVPDGSDLTARAEWVERAGAVAAYRELAGIDEHTESIGQAPSREQELHHHLWTQAAAALGPAHEQEAVDYRALLDHELYAVREHWAREQAWAPAYVAEEMRAAYELGRGYDQDAVLAGAKLATLEPTDEQWEATAAQFARSQRLAELTLERARQLEQIHSARGGWYAATAEARIADEAAAAELERRGLPARRGPDVVEQLPLFDTLTEDQDLELAEAILARDPDHDRGQTVDQDLGQEVVGHERGQNREPDVGLQEPADLPRESRREVGPVRGREPDDVELDEQVTEAVAAGRTVERLVDEPEPTELTAAAGAQAALAVEDDEQLALLEVTPDVADEVAAQPLHALHRDEPDPAPDLDEDHATIDEHLAAIDGHLNAMEDRAREDARTTLADARRQAEISAALRAHRAAAEPGSLEQKVSEWIRRREEEAELAEEQRRRWADYDREQSLGQGVDRDQGLGMGY